MHACMHAWMDGWMDDGWMDGWMDRFTMWPYIEADTCADRTLFKWSVFVQAFCCQRRYVLQAWLEGAS